MTFKSDWAKARLAYKNAPHGTRRARLKELQRMVARELIRECSTPVSTGAQETRNRQRGKIAA
jgi:hypothetical protein